MHKIYTQLYMTIITEIILIALVLICGFIFFFTSVKAEEPDTVATFRELSQWLDSHMVSGGQVTLGSDITVPADERYVYNTGLTKGEVKILTGGHTIYVEGELELWPYLVIEGDGSRGELLHVREGGSLNLISVTLDAGEGGTAIIQDEGSYLAYGDDENLDIPQFVCTGEILDSDRITAAAYSWLDAGELPVVRVPEGEDFTADMLPDTVQAKTDRENVYCYEDLEVFWDKTDFPDKKKRTIISGTFSQEYAQYREYSPRCLVVWESETTPYFLNVYIQSSGYGEELFFEAVSPQPGLVHITGSEDGETWTELDGEEALYYEPREVAEAGEEIWWQIHYAASQGEGDTSRMKYYRMELELEDGTVLCSEALELGENDIYGSSDIGGGRGGETSPSEGAPLPSSGYGSDHGDSHDGKDVTDQNGDSEGAAEYIISQPSAQGIRNENYISSSPEQEAPVPDDSTDPADPDPADMGPEDAGRADAEEEIEQDDSGPAYQIIIGIAAVCVILAGTVSLSVMRKKR